MHRKRIAVAAALAAASLAAQAADIQAGDWTVSIGGNVNAFYTYSDCKQPAGTVAGTALGDAALACGGKNKSTVIGNGLLPSYLSVGAKSRQGGFDVGAVIGIGVATATGDALSQNSTVDVRQGYLTFGNGEIGSFKMGRDYGLFGLHSVLGDMTLLGVGAATRATQNGRVSLGHLGAGMTYPGTYGQMTYSTPGLGGLGLDVGLMSPVDVAGAQTADSKGPQLQLRGTYDGGGFKAWVAAKYQKFEANGANPAFNMSAVELGGKADFGAFGLLGNFQMGKGLGILTDGDQGDIKGKNLFVQGTFKATDRLKLGLGYGRSRNDAGAGNGLRSNDNATAGTYFSLTPSITLVAEIGRTQSKAFSGASAKQNSLALGGILFF